MEERRGSKTDRFARLMGRGREETTPVALHGVVLLVVGIFVGILIAVTLALWLTLR